MSYKELIIEQLEMMPESVLAQVHEFIQLLKRAMRTNSALNLAQPHRIEDDPLVGLFNGSPDLATRSEDILTEEIKTY